MAGEVTGSVLLPAALAAGATVLLLRRLPDDRLSAVLPRAGPDPVPRRRPVTGAGRRLPLAACLLLAAALLLVLPPLLGLPAAAAAVLAGPRLLDRLEPAASRRQREQLAADLPLLLDLLAACLAGGAAMPAAAGAVSGAVGGPAGARLGQVASALVVGTPPADAWAALAGADPDDPLAAVGRLAVDARRRAGADGAAAARRAGVLAVAPLGLCFLPAFVLLGVVPVVAGLAGPLLSSL